jgi:hypothetical protein
LAVSRISESSAMPDFDLRVSVSDFMYAGMNQLRGEIPLAEFFSTWLEIAWGHALEDSIKAHRDKTYQRLAMNTNGYQQASAAYKITVTMPNNVKPFPGNDVTRRSPA